MTSTSVGALVPADLGWAEDFLHAHFGGRHQARRGELVDVLAGDAFVARDASGRAVGLATYRIDGDDTELTALAADPRGMGTGTALVDTVAAAARAAGAARLWLVTTNDNMRALRFYQRRGFRLVALRPGAVDEARARLKPTIPPVGDDGIPLHDELELARDLR